MAKGFRRVERDQGFLLPVDMREWLPGDHLVWFVLDVVDQLDIAPFCARHRLGGAGRRAYDPRMLLGLLIYAYAVGERSSRQIQRLCETDVAFRVICAQDVPDHSRIARFRKDNIDAFEGVFAQVLVLCARAGMVRLSTVAIDGTKIAANASLEASHDLEWFRRQAQEITTEAAAADEAEDAEFGLVVRGDELPPELAGRAGRPERIRRCLEELEAEAAEAAAEKARKDDKARSHLERVATEPVSGRAPAGVDRVEAARARVERERARRQDEIDAYNATVAAAVAEGRPRPSGRRVSDPEGGKRMKKALAGLQAALAAAADNKNTATTTSNNNSGSKKEDPPATRNVTDPDSRIMPARQGWIQGFNAQFAVSADHFLTTLGLTDNPADTGELADMLDRTQATAKQLNAHRKTPENIGTALCDAGFFSKENLTHPGPDRLIAPGKSRHIAHEAATNPASGPPPEGATAADAMRHRMRTPEAAKLYKKRGATVEPVNGIIKDRHGL